MTVVTVLGDAATTTALALAAGWRSSDQVVVVEADPSGGSLAAWLDVPLAPSLSTVVATLHGDGAPTGAADRHPRGSPRSRAGRQRRSPCARMAPSRTTRCARGCRA